MQVYMRQKPITIEEREKAKAQYLQRERKKNNQINQG